MELTKSHKSNEVMLGWWTYDFLKNWKVMVAGTVSLLTANQSLPGQDA